MLKQRTEAVSSETGLSFSQSIPTLRLFTALGSNNERERFV